MAVTRRYPGKRAAAARHRRTAHPPRPVGSRGASPAVVVLQRRRMLQLVVAGGIFVALVAWKLLFPQSLAGIAGSVREALGQDADFRAAFSAVGEAIAGEKSVGESLQEAYTAVFAPARYEAEQTAAVLAAAQDIPAPADQLKERLEHGTVTARRRPEEVPEAVEDLENVASQSLVHFNSAAPANVTFSQQVLGFDYSTPAQGTLTSTFGYREHPIQGEELFHYGLDIANVEGTEICAFADGTVKATGESSSFGKYLMISHDNGITSLYAHCSKVAVGSGDKVEKGQKVAEMGMTGGATGNHLHFELMDGETYLNPIYYVEVH